MLELVDVKKDYVIAGGAVHALKGVSIKFRNNEFVSILGASGCGKTTLLNIIGGLDKYTSGDLIIEGTSTKKFSDGDWDTYRNHSIGFIFQSYHLIPHQTILQNVELALTISGVSKEERRKRAVEALEKVGLADKINTRPNQLSGGQAQRVAIARALINDPEIVLADEPTGALDSKTSVQIMELLKEISNDRLVIMVTHNPELAERYSTRIIRLLDGEIIDDSMPYYASAELERQALKNAKTADTTGATDEEQSSTQPPAFEEEQTSTQPPAFGGGTKGGGDIPAQPEEPENTKTKTNKGRKKKSSMSVGMAFMLSLKNLLSKRRRTALVSVAGSIGIIGVSMVLAISAGVTSYINGMEDDMLSGFPVSVTRSTYDFSSLMELSDANRPNVDIKELASGNKVYVNSLLDTLGTFSTGFEKKNTITDAYLSYVSAMPKEYVNLIQYGYEFNIVNNLYTDYTVSNNLAEHLPDGADGAYNGGNMSVAAIRSMYAAVLSHVKEYATWGSMISSVQTFAEIPNNYDYVMSQYDVIAVDKNGEAVTSGYTEQELKEIFSDKETLFMVVDGYKIDDLTLAQYGYFTEDEFLDYAYKGIDEDKDVTLVGKDGFPYSKFVGANSKKFTYYTNDCVYNKMTYYAKPKYSDDEIRGIIKMTGANEQLAEAIINARQTSDEALRALLVQMNGNEDDESVQEYFDMFRLPSADEKTEGFVAGAYSTAYSYNDNGEEINLPAFSTKQAYKDRVELGVKLILQKKESVSYGCLETGFYYTNALTEYILEKSAESEIVNYVNENGALKEVPMSVDYYYVSTAEDGKEIYVKQTNDASIETGSDMMSGIIGSITGTGSTGLEAEVFGGSSIPSAIFIYALDFDAKNKITDYLDEWNKMCEGNTLVWHDASGAAYMVSAGDNFTLGWKNGKDEEVSYDLAKMNEKSFNKVFKECKTAIEQGCEAYVTDSLGAKFDVALEALYFRSAEDVGVEFEASGAKYLFESDSGVQFVYELGEKDKITYTDTVGMIIAMVNTMIQMITIALVAFTALSLVVSTVMVGIITYVSVVERIKEIGILRAVGARKKDIKRLFNAETFIIGLAAGVVGILITYLLSLIINLIVGALTGIYTIAALPVWQAVIMVCISVALTLISGLIPAAAAAKKDPVVALRTE